MITDKFPPAPDYLLVCSHAAFERLLRASDADKRAGNLSAPDGLIPTLLELLGPEGAKRAALFPTAIHVRKELDGEKAYLVPAPRPFVPFTIKPPKDLP